MDIEKESDVKTPSFSSDCVNCLEKSLQIQSLYRSVAKVSTNIETLSIVVDKLLKKVEDLKSDVEAIEKLHIKEEQDKVWIGRSLKFLWGLIITLSGVLVWVIKIIYVKG